ncbi:MAG: hypothetical protein ABIF71_09315 [Planctomycetota bacterium]
MPPPPPVPLLVIGIRDGAGISRPAAGIRVDTAPRPWRIPWPDDAPGAADAYQFVTLDLAQCPGGLVLDAVAITGGDGRRIGPVEAVAAVTFADYNQALANADRHVAIVREKRVACRFDREQVQALPGPRWIVIDGYQPPAQPGQVRLPAREWFEYQRGGVQGYLKADGLPGDSGAPEQPLYEIPLVAVDGHPDGVAAIRVANDFDKLYISVDFTVDNTLDPSDGIEVLFDLNGRILTLRSAGETPGVAAGFTPTPQAGYPHRYYELVVPFNEVSPDRAGVRFAVILTGARTI